eukprot:CAMPEP_0118673512 /NCGR_PEP_ID=MMETSP0800-20121206/365_1 /TAXON_ID=210618 ORGANISM="Striatella unipunctata, Strain CCMP2910" /NCGR_SAMPLE_ID=MMETSP0800 /ASSEMBLY_ACC=CAM_ASM_000638 /LENGTH=192 /DNA_ID=CAMNT_0006568587 /DNA_START=297 /DNA_END=875 /DNA_ORIENTATION=-
MGHKTTISKTVMWSSPILTCLVIVLSLVVLEAAPMPPKKANELDCKLESKNRDALMEAAWALYNNRAKGHYTQGPKRWNGILYKNYPPDAPDFSDCSSAVSWIYWTVFGQGPDFLNRENWTAGYTGTMKSHGRSISLSDALQGDLVFYGGTSAPAHVAIYVGGGMVISHGGDPVRYESVHYRSDINQVRSYL